MRVAAATVSVTNPHRNFVTLRIETDEGHVGLGDATLYGRELAVAAYLRNHVCPSLVGLDPERIEDTWQYLYRGAYWRGGPVTMAAVSAVDVALWDIKAKAAALPLYQLLGGATRSGCLAYGHSAGADLHELFDSVSAQLSAGFKAVRVQHHQTGSTWQDATKVVSPDPVERVAPALHPWDTAQYLNEMPTILECVRAEFGPDLKILHDARHRMRPIEAARLAKSLEPVDLFWLEDVTPAEDPEALRWVRHHSTTPLALGEVFNTVWDYKDLFQSRLIDYFRSPPTHAGGITGVKRIAELAGLFGIRSGFHGPSDVSPVGMAAALHLGLAIHNFGIQEYVPPGGDTLEVFQTSYEFSQGYLHPGSAIGLGVSMNQDAAEAFPYRRVFVPIARLPDGTLHDW